VPAFKKPLGEITKADIESLVRDAWPEDDELEFKSDIPGKEGRPDRWYIDQSGLNDYGRNQILEEVVAFANTYGGDVLIGIKETDDKPARASAIHLVPRCAELAHRLDLTARDCIEPYIPMLQARGIEFDFDKSGVIVLRVPRSRHAPHRLKPTLHCYRRAGDRTERMSMREIQDLTFAVSRGLAGIERRLDELRDRFTSQYNLSYAPVGGVSRLALNVRAVPASSDIYLDRVHNVNGLGVPLVNFHLTLNKTNKYYIETLHSLGQWQPILRGTRAASVGGDFGSSIDLFCDGAISYVYCFDNTDRALQPGERRSHVLYSGWLISLLLNAAAAADRFRALAGADAVDYALEIEVVTLPNDVPVVGLGRQWFAGFGVSGKFPAGSTEFPRYSLGRVESRVDLVGLFWRDFWNIAGIDANADQVTAIE
jgi:hypothetical protein